MVPSIWVNTQRFSFLISGTKNKKAAHANSDTMDILLRWIEIKRKFSKIDLLA